MPTALQINPGMTVSVSGKLYRVESVVKVEAAKGNPFVKMKLRELASEAVIEKNFKLSDKVEEVTVAERTLEFLYLEGKEYLFFDVDELETVRAPVAVVGELVHYLKEGTQVNATFYGSQIFALELPPFLELMVASTESGEQAAVPMANVSKTAVLETGARLEVPPFIEAGDIIKVDTRSGEYIQRV
jgi:elongation factor P